MPSIYNRVIRKTYPKVWRKLMNHLYKVIFLCSLLVLIGCTGVKETEETLAALQGELDVCRTNVNEQNARCQEEKGRIQDSSKLLIESNALLSSRLGSGEENISIETVELKSMLSETEFHVRELEGTIMEKETLIDDLESEIEGYSDDIRKALEIQQQALRDRQRSFSMESVKRSALNNAFDDLSVDFDQEVKEGSIVLSSEDGRLFVLIPNKMIFNPGKVLINEKGNAVLSTVASVLLDLEGWDIVVSSHTDSVAPGKRLKKKFPTNWELSGARAINAVRFFEEQGVKPQFIGAVAYSQFRPVASNKTRTGRASNLRLEIIVTPPADKEIIQEDTTEDVLPISDISGALAEDLDAENLDAEDIEADEMIISEPEEIK
jgi:chemotaxis protein MotB